MARMIRAGDTVLDLLDTWMELMVLEDIPMDMVALNKFEWNQLLKLHDRNCNQCAGVITLIKDNALMYKDLYVYYDGTEDNSNEYMFHMQEMRDQIMRIRNRMRQTEEAPMEVQGVTTGRLSAGAGGARPRSGNRNGPRPVRMDMNATIAATQTIPTPFGQRDDDF